MLAVIHDLQRWLSHTLVKSVLLPSRHLARSMPFTSLLPGYCYVTAHFIFSRGRRTACKKAKESLRVTVKGDYFTVKRAFEVNLSG